MFLFYLSSDFDYTNTFSLLLSLYLSLSFNKLPPVFCFKMIELMQEG